jgi:hypothetical protein
MPSVKKQNQVLYVELEREEDPWNMAGYISNDDGGQGHRAEIQGTNRKS